MTLTKKMYQHFLIPAFYRLAGDRRFKYLPEYEANLKKTHAEIEQYQLERLKALVRHTYDTVPYYKKLFDELKIRPEDIRTREDFKRIPMLEKSTVLNRPDELKSSVKYKLTKHFSGGSTGNKVFVYKDQRYHEISRAVWMRELASVGVKQGMRYAWVWDDQAVSRPFAERFGQNMLNIVNRRIVFNVFTYSDDDIEEFMMKRFNRFKPEYIYGLAGSIYEIAKVVDKRKLAIWQVKLIVTTAERLEHREFIEKVFKCKVFDQYGCSEVNIIAIDDLNGVMHSSDDFVLVELSEENEVLLTPLESYGMPLLRYKLGDVGLAGGIKADKDHPFNQFNLCIGRIYEVLQHKDGYKVSGGFIKQKLEDENVEIGEFQVVQKSLESVELNVVKDPSTTKQAVDRTAEIVKESLGASEVTVNMMDRYPTEKNGKRIAFKCMVKR
jgi:phenylacetate-CoA ligase